LIFFSITIIDRDCYAMLMPPRHADAHAILPTRAAMPPLMLPPLLRYSFSAYFVSMPLPCRQRGSVCARGRARAPGARQRARHYFIVAADAITPFFADFDIMPMRMLRVFAAAV